MIQDKIDVLGWQKLDITVQAQQRIDAALTELGADIRPLDIRSIETAFHAWRHLGEYDGEYAIYNGALEHCLLEKTLEHFISLAIINPKKGMVGMDVGSCQSVFPVLVRRIYSVSYYEQDLEYPQGVVGDRVGSSADQIPLHSESLDFMTLHCTFEHFEGSVDTDFISECARLLRPGGVCVVLPLYLNELHCNITGEVEEERRLGIGWDNEAQHFCLIPEWKNRFGRHYSPDSFMERVFRPAEALGLAPYLVKIENWEGIHPDLWLRWALVLRKSET